MNFTEVVQEVIRTTKRPDKLADIRREVNAAVNFFSVDSEFDRDIEELLLPINSGEYSQALSMSLLPRYRRMSYLKIGGTRHFLKELSRSEMLTECDLRNKWYIAGSSLNMNSTILGAAVDVAYYAYPPYLTDASPNFWMLEGNWPAVVHRACAAIFKDIGDIPSAQAEEGYATKDYLAFRKDQKIRST
ncbi:MAG: hypothetical protein AB7F19_07460 [Candidatus Babeliales bacterium]